MQPCCMKETIELSLAGCQAIDFFMNFLFCLYEKLRSTRNKRRSGITRSTPDSFVQG